MRNFRSCQECFFELNEWLSSLRPGIPVYLVSYCDSSVLERKRNNALSSQLMPAIIPLTIYSDPGDAFYNSYLEKITPEVILLNKDIRIISYDSVFEKGQTRLRPSFQKIITDFIK
jgi:hypothetical protein